MLLSSGMEHHELNEEEVWKRQWEEIWKRVYADPQLAEQHQQWLQEYSKTNRGIDV